GSVMAITGGETLGGFAYNVPEVLKGLRFLVGNPGSVTVGGGAVSGGVSAGATVGATVDAAAVTVTAPAATVAAPAAAGTAAEVTLGTEVAEVPAVEGLGGARVA